MDFPIGSGFQPWAKLNIRKALGSLEKFQRSSGLPIKKHYCVVVDLFLDKCFSYLFMLPSIFSHRPPRGNSQICSVPKVVLHSFEFFAHTTNSHWG